MGKIKTFLTFQENGEQAVRFYTSLIRNSRILSITQSERDGPIANGTLLNASFVLDGQEFMAMDGGSHFTIANGTSIYIDCDTQAEIDRLWAALSDGGEELACGWLKDRYGVIWQIVPSALGGMLTDPDPEKARRVSEAMLQMKKLDLPTLERAYNA